MTDSGLSDKPNSSSLTREAQSHAEKNEWIKAATTCQKALGEIESSGNDSDIASLTEFFAKCNFKAAFQAKNRVEFKELMAKSGEAWTRALTIRQGSNDDAHAKRALMGAWTSQFWTEDDSSARVPLARKILDLSEETAKLFDEIDEPAKALETRVSSLGFTREFINLQTDYTSLRNTFDRALAVGRITIDGTRREKEIHQLVETLGVMIWYLALEAEVVLPPSEFRSLAEETQALNRELQQLSHKIDTPTSRCLSKESQGHVSFDIIGNAADASTAYEEGLSEAGEMEDSLAIGRLQYLCGQAAFWLGRVESDPGNKRQRLERGEQFARGSISSLAIPLQTSELSAAHGVLARCLVGLANLAGLDLREKKKLLEEALEFASRGTKFESGTWGWTGAAHAQASVLYSLSKIETPERKIRLLDEALNVREQIVRVNDQLFPHFWNNVVAPYNLAVVRTEIAEQRTDPEKKKALLTQAGTEMRLCLHRGKDWGTNPGFLYRIAEHNETYGDILLKLHTLTHDQSLAQDSIKAYENAIEDFQASQNTANVAATRWKIANVQNDRHSLQLAALEFRDAAADYRKASAEIPGSASLFEEIAKYLDAWSIIESARLAHDEGEYLTASDNYSKVSTLLASTREWSHLSPLFIGRTLLERGENLSTEENHDQAIESFKAANQNFREETAQLENKLQETNNAKERQELENWLTIARQRGSNCNARIALEEARVQEKKGDKTASSRKFRESSEILIDLAGKIKDTQEKAETEGLAKFCEGWARMKEAEAQASPEKFSEAAETFLKLRSVQTKSPYLHLALANAAICRALGAGTQFQQTRDVRYYSELKKHTEAAAEYFRQAGFRKTEAWTRATQRLFDSLVFITDAESERNPKRKTELYDLAESHLRLAARLYDEAGFPTRKEEALSHLERVREEKRVLLEPLEALSQIPTATATSLSLSPRGRGQPGGLERFDEAYVVGDLNISHREVPLGSTFTLDLEIANVGKAPATLVKLQDVLPEGFEPAGELEPSPEGKLDLLGRTLDHLKTHTMKIQARAARKGDIELRPRLFYTDDSGSYKTYQFQAKTITVVDTGPQSKPLALAPQASPGTVGLPTDLRFDTERSREVFQSLVRDFLADYMTNRIYVEKAGWRTLVQITQETKIPRSSLYGPRGRDGPVLAELERRGLIESRIFPKERGRGGSVKRIRVAYDNMIVRRIVEEAAFRNK